MTVDSVEILHHVAFWCYGSKLASFFSVSENWILEAHLLSPFKFWQLWIPKSYKLFMEPSYTIVTPWELVLLALSLGFLGVHRFTWSILAKNSVLRGGCPEMAILPSNVTYSGIYTLHELRWPWFVLHLLLLTCSYYSLDQVWQTWAYSLVFVQLVCWHPNVSRWNSGQPWQLWPFHRRKHCWCAHTSLLANFQCSHGVVLVPFCIIYSLHLIVVWFLQAIWLSE